MTKKQKLFLEEINNQFKEGLIKLSDDAYAGLEEFNMVPATPKITEKGIQILKYMQNNCEQYNNVFKAKDIGEALGINGRSVSGSIRKLIADDYIEKMGTNHPVCYKLTDAGKMEELDN